MQGDYPRLSGKGHPGISQNLPLENLVISPPEEGPSFLRMCSLAVGYSWSELRRYHGPW